MPIARRTEAAEEDLRSIAYQIAVVSGRPETADTTIDELIDQCEKLAALPESCRLGQAAPEIGAGVRLFPVRRWVILFRYKPHGVDILRIADGSQNYLSWTLF